MPNDLMNEIVIQLSATVPGSVLSRTYSKVDIRIQKEVKTTY